MRFFRREVEVTLKAIGVITLIGLIVMPMAWGFEQRRQARTWQTIACAYRMKEVARQSPFLAGVDSQSDACGALERLGLQLDLARYVDPPRVEASTRWR
jgi:hypothetical protein